jgi:formate C-acetyltransferase
MEITTDKDVSRGIPSERISRIKQRFLSSPFGLDIERARHYTKVWKQMGYKGNSRPCMRAALALEKTLRNINIEIDEDEQLVGRKASGMLTEPVGIERGSFNGAIELLLNPLADDNMALPVGGLGPERQREVFESVTPEMREELKKEILPYWRHKTAHFSKIDRLTKAGLYAGVPTIGPISLYRMTKGLGGVKNALDVMIKNVGGNVGNMSLRSLLLAPRALRLVYEILPDLSYLVLDMQGHIVPGYPRVLELGFEGISDWADRQHGELEKGDVDYKRREDFLESVQVSAKAVMEFSNRYAELAEEMAAETEGPRKAELKDIAERCRRVPAKPPRTFMEALQSIWMTLVTLCISYGMDNVFTSGRMDQYLYPYYLANLEAGRIKREQALEAVEELLIKLAGNLIFGPNNITIGGLTREGEDAVNEVSYIFLDALENLKGLGNGLAVRISHKTPREFLLRACAIHRRTAGVAFYNDDIVIRDLEEEEYSPEDARDYSIVGCVEPTSTGNDNSYTAGNAVWLVGILEMALNRGRRLMVGSRRVGAKTRDPRRFRTFEDVKDAFEKQVSYVVDKAVRMMEEKDRVFEDFPTPLLSSTVEGCLESGKDLTWGGARYNNGHINAQALATVADSLAAIRWAVFDEKIISMRGMIEALSANFRGYDSLRQELLRKAPKFGNDDPRADELAHWACEVFVRETRKHRCWRGGNYRPSMFSSGTQDLEGALCGATPDGRLAGEVVANGISPTNGMEMSGATAVFHSVAQAGKTFISDGSALNMNLSPAMLASEENVEKLASLMEAYFVLGGRHVQFNPLDAETLRDAQQHPEKYPDLTVKVTGYSARFVDLSKVLQDDIIARTEFQNL